jgi:hypothetical protein
MMFFGVATASTVAVFILAVAPGVPGTPKAHAYAVGQTATDTTGGGYDFGSSFSNLISPFTGFFGNLKGTSNDMNIQTGSTSGSQTFDITPQISSGAQNFLTKWLSDFDNWFYGLTGFRLSGIVFVLLNALSWTLGLAQKVVGWLLGLFN